MQALTAKHIDVLNNKSSVMVPLESHRSKRPTVNHHAKGVSKNPSKGEFGCADHEDDRAGRRARDLNKVAKAMPRHRPNLLRNTIRSKSEYSAEVASEQYALWIKNVDCKAGEHRRRRRIS